MENLIVGTPASIKLGLQEGLQGSTQLPAEDGEESIVSREASTEQFSNIEVQGQEITKASASGKSEAGKEKSLIPSRETCEVATISVQGETRGVDGNEAGSRHETMIQKHMIQEHVSAGGDDIASLGDGAEAVLKLKGEAVANDLGNAMDLCQTSILATCHTKLSTTSFSIESHRQSACDQIDLPGIAEEATQTQNGGLSAAEIIREDEQVSLVDVKSSLPCIDEKREGNLQANAPQESDPGELQELVVGSQCDCNGLKRFMSIEIVNPSELDVGSEELKMGSLVDLDVDVSPTYQEEQENGILEATAIGTSQAGAGEDMSIISEKPGGKLCSKISMMKSEVLVVGSQVDCNGLKRCMSVEIVNPSELDVASEELKMGSPVDLDVDVSPTYQEEQGNGILEATATGASQAEADKDTRVEGVADDLGNAMDLCQTSDLATCHTKLSTMSFSIQSHRQSACDRIDLHGIAEEATSTQIGGLSAAEIIREYEQVSLVDVKSSLPCIDEKREGNLQANAARESDPGEIQELVVGNQGDCNGMKRSMSIEIVNPSELDVASEELKMGSPVNLDVDVSPAYQEEQGNGILEATATGTSSQAGAGEDMSIISREPGGNQLAKIEIQASRSNVCMDVSRWTQQLGWPHWHADQVHRLMLHHLGRGFTRHHQLLSVRTPSYVILKPASLVDGIEIIKKFRGHRNSVYCAVFDGMGQSVIMGSDDRQVKFQSAERGLCLRSCQGHEGDITDLAVSNRNKLVAPASNDICIGIGFLPSGVPVSVLQGCQNLLLSGVAAPRKPLSWDHIKDEHSLPARFRNLWFSHDSIVTCSRDGTAIIWMLQALNPNVRVGPWRRAYHLCVPGEATLGDEAEVADRHCEPRADNTADPGTSTEYCENLRLTIVDTKLCTASSMMKSDILDVSSLVESNGSMRSRPEVSPTEVENRGEEYGKERFVDVEAASTCPEEQEKRILEATCDGTSEAGNGEDLVGCPSSEVLKTYVRRRKQSHPTQTAREGPGALGGKAHVSNDEGLPKPIDVGHAEAKIEGASSPKDIKCYVRRRHRQTGLHNLTDAATQTQAHTPANFAKEKGRGEGSSRKSCTEKQASGYNKTDVQENNAVENGFIRSDYQPSWLPEGWALETKVRDGGTVAGIKDKFYHELKSGHRFRSRNEVMQYLDSVNSVQWQVKPGQWSVKTPIQNKKKNADHLASGRPSAVQSAPAKLFPSIQANSLNPTGASGTDVSNPHVTWAHVSGPNGPIWLPWGGSIDPGQENQSEVENQGTVVKAPVVSEGTLKAPSLSPSQRVHSATTGSIPPVETSSEQKELENRGKLIFRLKRKHPNQDAGKGRSKRPMYEVVHGEKTSKASSSTSTLNEQEKKVVSGEGTGQEVISGSLLMQGQGEKQSPVKEKPVTKAATLDLPVEQSMASMTKNSSGKPLARSAPSGGVSAEQPPFKKPRVENNPTADWSGGPNPLQPGPSQQEPFTALGIPATASASGLQHIAPFGANHTHVFMHHTESSIPVSWQYPFSSQPPTPVATPVPNLGPFLSSLHASVSGPFSSAFVPPVSGTHASAQVPPVSGTYSSLGTVPVPTFEHFSNPSRHLNTTSSFYPGAESGVGSRARDAAIVAKSVEVPSQPHKTTAHKSLTKTEYSKLLEGLGRRLCQVGLVQQPKIPSCSPENVTGAVELPKSQCDIQNSSSTILSKSVQGMPQNLV